MIKQTRQTSIFKQSQTQTHHTTFNINYTHYKGLKDGVNKMMRIIRYYVTNENMQKEQVTKPIRHNNCNTKFY